MDSTLLRMVVMTTMAAVLAACGSTTEPRPTPTDAPVTGLRPPMAVEIGNFPPYPEPDLPDPVADSLQAVLEEAVERGTVRGIVAAVIVADAGSWVGAAGVDPQGAGLTPDTRVETASIAKTITAAEVLRLVEEGKLGLDDAARAHLPPALARFDLNDATVRGLLGMRSGLSDPVGPLGECGATADQQLEALPSPHSRPGTTIEYANINYLLLGEILEHVTHREFWSVVHGDVLDHPGLENLAFTLTDARAADGCGVETDAATLARWGYELYGGFVLSDASSLRAMVDFRASTTAWGASTSPIQTPPVPTTAPASGHGGWGTFVTRLVAFPRTGVVVSVQANADSLEQITPIVAALRDAATL
ncbi:serine hydrolase domain-containing protein [Nocardioides gansuensis]|nr:serine hydrolase domain-containing protein [Nocardioides gansuensis]